MKKSFQGVKGNKKPSTRALTKSKDCSHDAPKAGGAKGIKQEGLAGIRLKRHSASGANNSTRSLCSSASSCSLGLSRDSGSSRMTHSHSGFLVPAQDGHSCPESKSAERGQGRALPKPTRVYIGRQQEYDQGSHHEDVFHLWENQNDWCTYRKDASRA